MPPSHEALDGVLLEKFHLTDFSELILTVPEEHFSFCSSTAFFSAWFSSIWLPLEVCLCSPLDDVVLRTILRMHRAVWKSGSTLCFGCCLVGE